MGELVANLPSDDNFSFKKPIVNMFNEKIDHQFINLSSQFTF